jgi:hypothetical protein
MNPKKTIIDPVCRPYCIFFKEGQKEDMACQGVLSLEKLVNHGAITWSLVKKTAKKRAWWWQHKPVLEKCVCRFCDFLAEDCDFQSDAPSDDLEPCGGYVVLAFLLDQGHIDENDLKLLS